MRQITLSLTVAAAVCAAALTDAGFFEQGRGGLSKDHSEAARLHGRATAQVRNDSPKLDSGDLRDLLQVLRKQLYGCWSLPAGVSGGGADAPSAIVRFKLKQDGSLAGEPVVVGSHADSSHAFAKTALAAVKRCQPLRLPPNLYQFWKEVEVNFVAMPRVRGERMDAPSPQKAAAPINATSNPTFATISARSCRLALCTKVVSYLGYCGRVRRATSTAVVNPTRSSASGFCCDAASVDGVTKSQIARRTPIPSFEIV